MKPITEIKPGLFVQETKPGKYKVVNPIKNKDGSINWRNLIIGNTTVFTFTIIIVVIVIILYSAYVKDMNTFRAIVEDPCKYCFEGIKVVLPNKTNTMFNPF